MDHARLDQHIRALELAEYQYKLALQIGPQYDVEPRLIAFSYGPYSLGEEDLRVKGLEMAAATAALQWTTMHALAVVLDTALEHCIPGRFGVEGETATLARLARLLRNAFAHNPFFPVWSIKNAAMRKVYSFVGVMTIDARDLDGCQVDWRQYGGPIAVLRLAQRGRRLLEVKRDTARPS